MSNAKEGRGEAVDEALEASVPLTGLDDDLKPSSEVAPPKPPRRYELIAGLVPKGGEKAMLDQLGEGGFAVFSTDTDDASRTVRADVLYALLLGLKPDWKLEPPRLYLEGAIIEGGLDLQGLRRQYSGLDRLPSLTFAHCTFSQVINLNGAEFDELTFDQCEIGTLSARGLRVASSLIIYDCSVAWRVDLSQCRVDGDLMLGFLRKQRESSTSSDANAGNEVDEHDESQLGSTICDLSNARIEGDLLAGYQDGLRRLTLTGLRVAGKIDLSQTRIGGIEAENCVAASFLLPGAVVGWKGKSDDAIDISGSTVGFFNGRTMVCLGSLKSVATRIDSDFDLGGAVLMNPGDYALALGRSKIGGAFYFRARHGRRALAEGLVSLIGAEIENRILIQGVTFSHPGTPDGEQECGATALDLRDLTARRLLELDQLEFGEGALLLEGARVRELSMDRSAWPQAGMFTLHEAEYEALELTERSEAALPDTTKRVKKTGQLAKSWLERAVGHNADRHFAAQPFEQLSKTLRAAGFGREADDVAILKRKRRLACGVDGFGSRQLSRLMGLLSRHGYSSVHSIAFTILVALIGSLALSLAITSPNVIFVPVEVDLATSAPRTNYMIGLPREWIALFPDRVAMHLGFLNGWTLHSAPNGCPALVTPLYALDLIVPLLDLGQESACRMETHGLVGGWIQMGRGAYQIVGAIMTAILLTTLTGVLRRD